MYLATPYGFSTQQRKTLLPRFVEVLSALGLDVYEPFEHAQQLTFAKDPGWAYEVGQKDLEAVRDCDGMFAIVNGSPPDEGVMIELGAAIALEKPTFLFRDDFRRSSDCEGYPLNLMIFTGLPRDEWQAYWYTDIDQLTDPNKALATWAGT